MWFVTLYGIETMNGKTALELENQFLKEQVARRYEIEVDHKEQINLMIEVITEQDNIIEVQDEVILRLSDNNAMLEVNIRILENKLVGE